MPRSADGIRSQVRATIVQRALTRLFSARALRFDRSDRLDSCGNTDFPNALERARTHRDASSTRSAARPAADSDRSSRGARVVARTRRS
ncbi:MAG: hypothetical protein HRU00_02805 [Myxococcales bacterium]|nr:hypothetical protein [Myxococcales bacterium]